MFLNILLIIKITKVIVNDITKEWLNNKFVLNRIKIIAIVDKMVKFSYLSLKNFLLISINNKNKNALNAEIGNPKIKRYINKTKNIENLKLFKIFILLNNLFRIK